MTTAMHSRNETAIIFGAALVQGIGLYAVHLATRDVTFETPAPAWTGALLALSLFLPLTAQMLRSHLHLPRGLITLGALAVLLAGFGWHQHLATRFSLAGGAMVGTAFLLFLWWCLALPFMLSWIRDQRWRPPYPDLFLSAWHTLLILAQALVFCGLFWALLVLGAGLFKLLDIDLPTRVVSSQLFRTLVLPLGFALGLQFSSNSPRLTSTLMELALTPLKWLSLLSGLILLTFTPVLMVKLPSMISQGQHIVPASILLWLIAVSVLFVNAAFRDGQTGTGLPRRIELALRAVMPFMIIISLAALYALYVRIDAHGLTVARVWAVLTAGIALLYSAGYTVAAMRPGPWMAGIAPTNTAIALLLIVALTLMFTPLLSPQRLAANSLYERIVQSTEAPSPYDSRVHSLGSTGQYGQKRLQALAELQDHPHAALIRQQARGMLQGNPIQGEPGALPTEFLSDLPIHPAGQTLTPAEMTALQDDLSAAHRLSSVQIVVAGVFTDLDGDGKQEFILLHQHGGLVYVRTAAGLDFSTSLYTVNTQSPQGITPEEVTEGKLRLLRPRWLMLEVGGRLLGGDSGVQTVEFSAVPAPDDANDHLQDDAHQPQPE